MQNSANTISKGWQATKSELMRNAILEATCQSFTKYGYANTTTPLIAEMANVSRGAMTHHFKSREDVIFAGVEYLYEKRIAQYESLMREAADAAREHEGVEAEDQRDLISRVARGVWAYFTLPTYYVHLELIMASRTDSKLAELIERLNREAEQVVPSLFKNLFPEVAKSEHVSQLVFDLLFFTLRGMSISYIHLNKSDRIESMLDFLVDDCMRLVSSAEN